MRVFKNKYFARWAQKENLSDQQLREAVCEMDKGLVDANLGGNVYKKRIALAGKGKRGSVRTVLAFRSCEKAFFIVGYAKNEKATMTLQELMAVKKLAKEILSYDEQQLAQAMKQQALFEVLDHEKK